MKVKVFTQQIFIFIYHIQNKILGLDPLIFYLYHFIIAFIYIIPIIMYL